MANNEQSFNGDTMYEVAAHGEYNVKVILHRGRNKEQAEQAFKRISEGQARSSGVCKLVELYEVNKTLLGSANEESSDA